MGGWSEYEMFLLSIAGRITKILQSKYLFFSMLGQDLDQFLHWIYMQKCFLFSPMFSLIFICHFESFLLLDFKNSIAFYIGSLTLNVHV